MHIHQYLVPPVQYHMGAGVVLLPFSPSKHNLQEGGTKALSPPLLLHPLAEIVYHITFVPPCSCHAFLQQNLPPPVHLVPVVIGRKQVFANLSQQLFAHCNIGMHVHALKGLQQMPPHAHLSLQSFQIHAQKNENKRVVVNARLLCFPRGQERYCPVHEFIILALSCCLHVLLGRVSMMRPPGGAGRFRSGVLIKFP
jgi:hypothetical protein